MLFESDKTKASKRSDHKKEPTCLDCTRHNRFWVCEVKGSTMNPYYCAGACRYFKPKEKLRV